MPNTDINILSLVIIGLMLVIIAMVLYLFFLYKKNKPKLVESSDHYHEDAYKLLPESIIILNADNKIIYLNPEAENMLGCKLRRVMGREYSDVFTLLNPNTRRVLQGVLGGDTSLITERISRDCLLQTTMNQTFSIELNLIPLRRYSDEDQDNLLLVLKNITERKALESKLSNLEKYDGLTRMLNRKSFDAEIKQLIDNAHKHSSKHVLAYFSIDQFQVINDTIGYASGDNLITCMGDQIKNHLFTPLDIVGRVGANEFAVVFCERKLASAIKTIQDILNDVSEFNFMSRGHQYSITMSCGFVIVDQNTTSSTRAITEANTACNLANKRGGNRLSAYKSEDSEIQKMEGNLEWKMILKKAQQENRFRMHAQPIHPLKASEYKKPFYHYELLIRLSDEKGNPIAPDEFISAAEYYSLMPEIDRWVIKNVLKQISALPEQSPLPVFAINLSGQSLNDLSFLDFVTKEIKASGVDPQMLCFEITEQVAVEDLTLINALMASLKALGCKFSLDDFGTGVSSYSYLGSLDVDYLKIDGSFVKNIANDEVAKAMVQSINQVGHTMNLKVIAEYVENEKIIQLLREMGVDYGQGYEIARPGPLETVIRNHMLDSHVVEKVAN